MTALLRHFVFLALVAVAACVGRPPLVAAAPESWPCSTEESAYHACTASSPVLCVTEAEAAVSCRLGLAATAADANEAFDALAPLYFPRARWLVGTSTRADAVLQQLRQSVPHVVGQIEKAAAEHRYVVALRRAGFVATVLGHALLVDDANAVWGKIGGWQAEALALHLERARAAEAAGALGAARAHACLASQLDSMYRVEPKPGEALDTCRRLGAEVGSAAGADGYPGRTWRVIAPSSCAAVSPELAATDAARPATLTLFECHGRVDITALPDAACSWSGQTIVHAWDPPGPCGASSGRDDDLCRPPPVQRRPDETCARWSERTVVNLRGVLELTTVQGAPRAPMVLAIDDVATKEDPRASQRRLPTVAPLPDELRATLVPPNALAVAVAALAVLAAEQAGDVAALDDACGTLDAWQGVDRSILAPSSSGLRISELDAAPTICQARTDFEPNVKTTRQLGPVETPLGFGISLEPDFDALGRQ
jgi:hypothetical protein